MTWTRFSAPTGARGGKILFGGMEPLGRAECTRGLSRVIVRLA